MKPYFILFVILNLQFCINMDKINDQNELNDNKSKWEATSTKNYEIKLKSICNCMMNGTYLIVVKNGIVDTVIPDTAVYPEINPSQYSHVSTVESLFKNIQDAIDENAEKLSVVYNKKYGYPEKIEIDMNLKAIDDEYYYEIKEIKIN